MAAKQDENYLKNKFLHKILRRRERKVNGKIGSFNKYFDLFYDLNGQIVKNGLY